MRRGGRLGERPSRFAFPQERALPFFVPAGVVPSRLRQFFQFDIIDAEFAWAAFAQ